jgi:hypothetical protein
MIKSRGYDGWGMREIRHSYILVGKHEGTRPLRKPRHKWEDNIKINLKEIRLEGVDWIHMAQDMDQKQDLMNMVMKL